MEMVGVEATQGVIAVVRWYLNEAQRFLGKTSTPEHMQDVETGSSSTSGLPLENLGEKFYPSRKKENYMKKAVTALCALSVLAACGGRTANPVMIAQYGDQSKSCKALKFEIMNIQGEIQRLLPKTDKTVQNVALGVAGWFLLVPWFFMDFKNAEATEYEAYRQRYNHLSTLAMSKSCQVETIDLPSVQEVKQKYEEQQKQQN